MSKRLKMFTVLLIMYAVSHMIHATPGGYTAPDIIPVDIYYNSELVEYELSPVIINGRTYVPLRESAEMVGMGVEWNENNNTVSVTTEDFTADYKNGIISFSDEAVSGYSQFEYLLKDIPLPDSAEIVDFEFLYDNFEPCLYAKNTMPEEDAAKIKELFADASEEKDDTDKQMYNRILGNLNTWFDWWDLKELPDNAEVFEWFERGLFVMTKNPMLIFVPGADNMCTMYVEY